MTSFFQRLVNSGGKSESGPRRLALAAFGKHPGWNDHIPGIGVETESLAHAKQALYVAGIGGRIDAGAWRNLEAGKRLEGFDHVFLWLRAGHVLLGRMQSSEDGLRRKEYPLVLCVDAEGTSPATLLSGALPELDRLSQACRATTSAEVVADECRRAQDRLRAMLTGETARPNEPALGLEARRRFLEHRDLGPDRIGLLRLLHELDNAGVTNSRHVRMPLAENSRTTALVLWTDFLRHAVPATVPLLLISRPGVDWLDMVVGEPASDDYFCLQAAPTALPLASQVPYDLAPTLQKRLQELETKFTGVQAASLPAPVPPAVVNPPLPTPARDAAPAAPERKGLFRFFMVLGMVMLVGGLAAVWWFSGNRGSPEQPQPVATVPRPTPEPVGNVEPDPIIPPPTALIPPATTETLAPAAAIQNQVATPDASLLLQKPLPPPLRDAKHQAEDANFAQLAVSAGNYARVLEICQQWPEISPFQELMIRVAAETNQLRQLKELLLSGKYEAILTNQMPENPQFAELQKVAMTEKKILDQAVAEFAVGNHAFLKNESVLSLKVKPPFQTLLKAGNREADLLRQAESLRAENKPEAAMNLLVAHQLEKPPFAGMRQWAAAELNRLAGVRRDQQEAEDLFARGDYARALNLCNQRAGLPAFAVLAQKITSEQNILSAGENKSAVGDYSFLGEWAAQDYRTKPPFVSLQRNAEAEQKTLTDLSQLRQADNWPEVLKQVGALAPNLSAKKPFAELRAWAQEKYQTDEALKGKDPKWLDVQLETMLVQFNLVSPARTAYAKDARMLEGVLGTAAKNAYLANVSRLRAEYEKRGWLDKERTRQLKELETTIRYRD